MKRVFRRCFVLCAVLGIIPSMFVPVCTTARTFLLACVIRILQGELRSIWSRCHKIQDHCFQVFLLLYSCLTSARWLCSSLWIISPSPLLYSPTFRYKLAELVFFTADRCRVVEVVLVTEKFIDGMRALDRIYNAAVRNLRTMLERLDYEYASLPVSSIDTSRV